MATYTTTEKTRIEAGLEDNIYITDATINTYIIQANARIKGAIAARYSLSALDTNFSGSSAESVLDMIEKLLAAGMIINMEDLGSEEGDASSGNAKISRAESMVDDIVSGSLLLLDSNSEEYTLKNSNPHAESGRLIEEDIESTDSRDFYDGQKF